MTKIKILLVVIVFSALGISVFGQSGSAYTRIGIGDIEYSYSPRRLGMGQLGTSVADYDFISPVNPAGLYRLSRTRIEANLTYNGLFLNNGTNNTYYAETEFTGFSIAFPVSRDYGIGAAIGITPYSNISYKVLEPAGTNSTSEEYSIFYEGRGGLSKLFIGSSYRLPFDLIIGATLDYYFGNLNYFSRTEFVTSSIQNAQYERTYSPKGLGSTVGLISPDFSGILNSENISDLRFGVTGSLISELDADTVFVGTSNFGIDTIASASGKISIPLRLSAGLSFVFDKNYLISIDYVTQAWSEYKLFGAKNPYLRNAMKLAGGFEYRPAREAGSTFWEQIIWRAGLSYEQTQYKINGTGINQVSFAGGFSMPLSLENTLDIGLQYSMRGTNDPGIYKENVIKLGVGVSLGEIWFIRQEK